MRFRSRLLICILISLTQASSSYAKIVELFQCKSRPRPTPAREYDELIKRIRVGDVLIFCDGKSYTVSALAGLGNRTMVFRTEERPDAVLRISLLKRYIPLLQETIDASLKMSELELPHPDVLGFFKNQYVLTEDMGTDLITFRDWAFKRTRGMADDDLQSAYLEFAKKTARSVKVSDSHWKNIAYSISKQEWFFLDFCDDIRCASSVEMFGVGVFNDVRTPLKLGFLQVQAASQLSAFRKKRFRRYQTEVMSEIASERKRLFFTDIWSTCNNVLKGISQIFHPHHPEIEP